jgi:hypothetical protein
MPRRIDKKHRKSADKANEPNQSVGVLFSDVFEVGAEVIERYGALNISLVADLPVFIDPFLLFNSENPTYQSLHKEIIRYLLFLREQAVSGNVTPGLLKSWFHFKEVDQTWLGFSVNGNRGTGLGGDFANSLKNNFGRLLDPDQALITKAYHLEKLCLIAGGVGRDRISDFTTNLIKGYLCEYTEQFATEHLKSDQLDTFSIAKAEFNYTTRAWKARQYRLPVFNNDFVLLVPVDILSRDETWINRGDLTKQFDRLPDSLPDDALRAQVNNYFIGLLPKKPTAPERAEAITRTLLRYPELVDHYIRLKEETGEEAKSLADIGVGEVKELFTINTEQLVQNLVTIGYYDIPANSYENVLARAKFLKHVIEDQDLYRLFWRDGKLLVSREADIQLLFKLTWYRSAFDYNAETNNGRGPVDGKASIGSGDKSLIEFKLASNSQLERNLEKQVAVYEAANRTDKSVKVIVSFTVRVFGRTTRILKRLKLTDAEDIVLIDARRDNKPSASNA